MAESGGISFRIHLAVGNLGVTEAFYSGILELPVRRPYSGSGIPDHLILRAGGCEVVFLEDDKMVKEYPPAEHGLAAFPKGIGVMFRFAVLDLLGVYDALTEEGLEIAFFHEHPVSREKELAVYDPDGYLVVIEELHRPD